MILESIGIIGCLTGINYCRKYIPRDEREIRDAWEDTMRHSNLYNKDADEKGDNKFIETYTVYKCFKTTYGWKMIVVIPKGLTFSKLEENKEIIENGLKGYVQFMENKLSSTATIKVNNQEFDLDEKFVPIDIKPYQLNIGRDLFKKDIIINMNEYPHVLITGNTGTGKSQCMFAIVSNTINKHKEGIGLWLAQVSDKKDVGKFKNCKQTRYYAQNLQHSYDMFCYIKKIMKERNDILDKYNMNNIYQYNKKFKKEPWSYEYIIIDEIKSFMINENKTIDANYTIKQKCNVELQNILREARSVGFFVIASCQRSDTESLNPSSKSLFNNKINFRQPNMPSAMVTTNAPKEIIGIPNREAYFEGYESFHIKTLFVGDDNTVIDECIKESVEENHKYFDLNISFSENLVKIKQKLDKNNENKQNNLVDYGAIFISETESKENKNNLLSLVTTTKPKSKKQSKVKANVSL